VTNEQDFDSIELMDAIQAGFGCSDLENPMGKRCRDTLRVNFDRKLKPEFNGTKVTSNAGKKLKKCLQFGEDLILYCSEINRLTCIAKSLIWLITDNSVYLYR
jgi:hypothetical protein